MSELKKAEDKPGKKFDICYFRVPVEITHDPEGDTIASFKEIEHKDFCYKKEEITFETSQDAIIESGKLSAKNMQTLKLAAKTKKTGDTVTRIILCEHNKIEINTNI